MLVCPYARISSALASSSIAKKRPPQLAFLPIRVGPSRSVIKDPPGTFAWARRPSSIVILSRRGLLLLTVSVFFGREFFAFLRAGVLRRSPRYGGARDAVLLFCAGGPTFKRIAEWRVYS